MCDEMQCRLVVCCWSDGGRLVGRRLGVSRWSLSGRLVVGRLGIGLASVEDEFGVVWWSVGGWGSIAVGWWSVGGSVGVQLQVGVGSGGCRLDSVRGQLTIN